MKTEFILIVVILSINDLSVNLTNQTLNVKFIAASSTTATSVRQDPTTGEYWGYYYDIYNKIFTAENVTLNHKEISAESLSIYSSKYTACVNDVRLGYLDMCLGGFLVTPERTALTTMAAPTKTNYYNLAIMYDSVDNNDWLVLFRPLSFGCWVAIVVTIFVSIFIYMWLEKEQGEDLPQGGMTIDHILNSFYFAFLGMTTGGSAYSPNTRLGKLMAMGFSFYAMLVLVVFTSNTTSFLTVKNASSKYSNTGQIIRDNKKICSLQAMEKSFTTIYPSANLEFFVTYDELYEKFISRDCYGITPVPGEETKLKLNLCGRVHVMPEVLFAFDSSVPFNPVYIKVINNYITEYKSEGIIESIISSYDGYNRKCGEEPTVEAGQLTWAQLKSMFYIYGIWLLVLILLKLYDVLMNVFAIESNQKENDDLKYKDNRIVMKENNRNSIVTEENIRSLIAEFKMEQRIMEDRIMSRIDKYFLSIDEKNKKLNQEY